MDIQTRDLKNNIIVLDINGEIDLYNAPEIKKKIKEQMDEGKNNVIVNLDKVSYVDSSGIGVLISSLSQLKKVGGGLKIINVYASVKKVFELTKLTSFFEIFESEEEAVKSFN
ncbi:MAG: STAS domain-containing protein [Spirochaetota bacterium]|nr:STAS domain-containing protein [Spirochaetota bacterium]